MKTVDFMNYLQASVYIFPFQGRAGAGAGGDAGQRLASSRSDLQGTIYRIWWVVR